MDLPHAQKHPQITPSRYYRLTWNVEPVRQTSEHGVVQHYHSDWRSDCPSINYRNHLHYNAWSELIKQAVPLDQRGFKWRCLRQCDCGGNQVLDLPASRRTRWGSLHLELKNCSEIPDCSWRTGCNFWCDGYWLGSHSGYFFNKKWVDLLQ